MIFMHGSQCLKDVINSDVSKMSFDNRRFFKMKNDGSAQNSKQVVCIQWVMSVESLPARERGLKLRNLSYPSQSVASLPARERGLKQFNNVYS